MEIITIYWQNFELALTGIRLSTRGHDTTVSGGGMAMVSEGGESIDMDTEEDASHTTEPLEVRLVLYFTDRDFIIAYCKKKYLDIFLLYW